MNYFVTGIGTDIGKTIVAAILVEALKADYWKPVQAGGLDFTDTDQVKALITNTETVFHPERYRLNTPASPHHAANVDQVVIKLKDFHLPNTANSLIVEGAGGLMVPLNNQDFVLDLIKQLNLAVILVSQYYLGSINHTILSVHALRNADIPIKGIIFNGEENPSSKQIILDYCQIECLGSINQENEINQSMISKYASQFKLKL